MSAPSTLPDVAFDPQGRNHLARERMSAHPDPAMTHVSGAVKQALREAVHVLNTLAKDIQFCGTRPRQRTLTSRVRSAMDTVDWVIGYDSARCDHDREAAS